MKKITLLLLTLSAILGSVLAADPFSGDRSAAKVKILVIPFKGDASRNANAIGEETAWVLGRKLKLKDMAVITWQAFISKHESDGLTKETDPYDFSAYRKWLEPDGIRWVAGGEIRNVEVDREGIEGPWLAGLCSIPIQAELTLNLYRLSDIDSPVLSESTQARQSVPRVRIFGLFKNPIPHTPRAVDAFVHDSVLDLAEKAAAFIHASEKKELSESA